MGNDIDKSALRFFGEIKQQNQLLGMIEMLQLGASLLS